MHYTEGDMTDGPRHRGSAAAGCGEEAAQGGQEAAQSSVALKKEIGLVSACGIIVGQYQSSFSLPLYLHSDII